MRLLLMLLGVVMAQVSLVIAFHTSHLIVSILLLFVLLLLVTPLQYKVLLGL